MKIELEKKKIRDVFNGFVDDGDDGVFAYGGRLTIRPAYQREFVYDLDKQRAVIHTILCGYPLNTMYWVKTGDDTYEILDGQQRTMSIMMFLSHKLDVEFNGAKYYEDGLPEDIYERLLNYELLVYVCEGTESEKLAWFGVVNTGGLKLTEQEIRNSVYTGPWLSAAKAIFSKRGCSAKRLSDKYINGTPERQELLEKALKGICGSKSMRDIREYMAEHVSDPDADELWQYFQQVIHWIEIIFPEYRSDMKGLDWCRMYNQYHNRHFNSAMMKADVKNLHENPEIQNYKGVYEYLLAKDSDPFAERLLNLREFDEKDKRMAYEKQDGICPICHQRFTFEDMEGDHIVPWSRGGRTVPGNCQMLCSDCNKKKSNS